MLTGRGTSPVTISTSVSVNGHPTSHQYDRCGLKATRSSLIDRYSASLSLSPTPPSSHATQT